MSNPPRSPLAELVLRLLTEPGLVTPEGRELFLGWLCERVAESIALEIERGSD